MRLNFATGVEFTFIPNYPRTRGINFLQIQMALKDCAENLLSIRGLAVEELETDPNVIEFSSPVCYDWEKLKALYIGYREIADQLRLVPQHPRLSSGGGHIHQSGGVLDDPYTRIALYRLVALHPEINWGFNAPEDIYNGSPLADPNEHDKFFLTRSRKQIEEEVDYGLYAFQFDSDLMKALKRVGGKARSLNTHSCHETVEHRYFDAPRDLSEFKLHVRFAEALVKYAARRKRALLQPAKMTDYPIPRVLGARLGPYRTTKRLLDFIEEIGLNSAPYRPLVGPNIRRRYDWRTVQ